MGKRSAGRKTIDAALKRPPLLPPPFPRAKMGGDLSSCELTALGCAAFGYPGASAHDSALLMAMRGEWKPRHGRLIDLLARRIRKGRSVLSSLEKKGLVELAEDKFTCPIWVATAKGKSEVRSQKAEV